MLYLWIKGELGCEISVHAFNFILLITFACIKYQFYLDSCIVNIFSINFNVGCKIDTKYSFTDNKKPSTPPSAKKTIISENNNSFYKTSTPNNKVVNGDINEDTLNLTLHRNIDTSPIRNLAKEQFLNSVNANTTSNGTNTTTIIADIEGEIKKKPKISLDKTYYIAKEILMTELTYKKDLDVINIVSIYYSY